MRAKCKICGKIAILRNGKRALCDSHYETAKGIRCAVDGCMRFAERRDMCMAHYIRRLRYGRVERIAHAYAPGRWP